MGEWGRGKVGRRTGRGRRSGNYGQNIIYERRIHEKEKDIPSVFLILIAYITMSSLLINMFLPGFQVHVEEGGKGRSGAVRYIQDL